jgi:hypothetical protein
MALALGFGGCADYMDGAPAQLAFAIAIAWAMLELRTGGDPYMTLPLGVVISVPRQIPPLSILVGLTAIIYGVITVVVGCVGDA